MKLLGLDIGTNSVGSAWVDTYSKIIQLGVSVFPAGVEESEEKRGAPKNQARRNKRSSRRNLRRRAKRKRRLRKLLIEVGLLPNDPEEQRKIFGPRRKGEDFDLEKWNPWRLRREGLERELCPYEFGRILVHLNQHRGALGFDVEVGDEGKIKESIDHVRIELLERYAETKEKKCLLNLHNKDDKEENTRFAVEFRKWIERNDVTIGRMMADLLEERRVYLLDKNANPKKNNKGEYKYFHYKPIRNRLESFEFHADRVLIRDEFQKLWKKQKTYNGELSSLLNEEPGLYEMFDNPTEDKTWRHKGEIFGQHRTYWDTGTLGRCDLEPTDRCVSVADMYAQEFRVIETVNNIRIKTREEQQWRSLDNDQRQRVIDYLRGGWFTPLSNSKRSVKPKRAVQNPKPKHIREVLGIDKKTLTKQGNPENFYDLNIDNDPDREINTDWFYRHIVHDVFGEKKWIQLDKNKRESVNRAIQKFDTEKHEHFVKLRQGATTWWGLSSDAADKMIEAWKIRPKLGKRLNLSRHAILNLLPYMNQFDQVNERWPTQQEARITFSKDINAQDVIRGGPPDEAQRRRYATGTKGIKSAGRYYMKQEKHQIHCENGAILPPLPPATIVSNPVVRKAIHEVRKHIIAYMRKFGCKPDRVVIEYFRGVINTARQRNEQLQANRKREKERKEIEKDLAEWGITRSNWKQATFRVRLCKEQNGICPFSIKGPDQSRTITPMMAAEGHNVEIEHIIPESITGKTMDFNNVVLCFRNVNRNKGQRTPLDWLGADGLVLVLQRLEKTNVKKNKIKWKRLQAKTPDPEEFRKSQMTDTAYAARQVTDYIQSALYANEAEGKRFIFPNKGEYTARLRADWGLYESEIDREHGLEPHLEESVKPEELKEDPELVQALRKARKDPTKDRIDHRNHSIDALVNALTGPELQSKIGSQAIKAREYKEKYGRWPRRTPIEHPTPWNSVEEFREEVLMSLKKLVVSHRPEKRRLIGALHNDMAHGKSEKQGRYVRRKHISELLPKKDTDSASWVKHIRDDSIRDTVKRNLLKEEIEVIEIKPKKGRPSIKFVDKKTGKTAKIDKIRKALSDVRMSSGVPIRSMRMDIPIGDPVPITGKDGVIRFYESDNNHHVEILEDKEGKWSGEILRMYDAAKRNIKRLKALKKAGVPSVHKLRKLNKSERKQYQPIIARVNQEYPIVNRIDRGGIKFIMSLSGGEMIYARPWDSKSKQPIGIADYYVVAKLDKNRIYFSPHWDARKADKQDRWSVSPGDLKYCGPDNNTPPKKVRVSPLGEVKELNKD